MSSISLPLKMLIAGTAFAGLTMLACGGDDSGSGNNNSDTGGKTSDAGKKDGGSSDAGKKDSGSSSIPQAVEGEDCTGIGGMCANDACDQAPCFSQCVDGTYGPCDTLSNLIPDSGIPGLGGILGDAGGDYKFTDAGVVVKFGDASVTIPPQTCPSSMVCSAVTPSLASSVIQQVAGSMLPSGSGFCYESGGLGLPPSCSAMADCQAAGLQVAACVGGYCVSPCNK